MKVEAIRNPYDHRVVELWACRANERSFIAILSVDSFVYESFYQDLSDGIDVELEVTRVCDTSELSSIEEIRDE